MSDGFKYIEFTKKTKAQKRRDAKASRQAEQQKRIEEGEKIDEHRDRTLESQRLEEILEANQLAIYDIDADGDCLYKAVEHQLGLASDSLEKLGSQELRQRTSQYMLTHADEFSPFLLTDDGVLMDNAQFRKYCEKIAKTKEWGGHLELTAISNFTQKSISIFQADSNVPIKIEPKHDSGKTPILLSFHKHLYHLGEHYNSVVKKEN